jgi:hypothetical protein
VKDNYNYYLLLSSISELRSAILCTTELKRAYKIISILRDELDRFSVLTPFMESWKQVKGKFEQLIDFAGGLATVFPGTPTVESDFSITGWEKEI